MTRGTVYYSGRLPRLQQDNTYFGLLNGAYFAPLSGVLANGSFVLRVVHQLSLHDHLSVGSPSQSGPVGVRRGESVCRRITRQTAVGRCKDSATAGGGRGGGGGRKMRRPGQGRVRTIKQY